MRGWLRSEHGLPQNSQWAIAGAAARAAGWVRPSVAEYVDGQYSGPKARLRPICDVLAAAITSLGDDVTVSLGSVPEPGRAFPPSRASALPPGRAFPPGRTPAPCGTSMIMVDWVDPDTTG